MSHATRAGPRPEKVLPYFRKSFRLSSAGFPFNLWLYVLIDVKRFHKRLN